MTNEEIMKMAHAAGWEQGSQFDDCGDCSRFDVVKFARMVAEVGCKRVDAEQMAEPVAWRPDVCPITGLPFFMWIEHHETGQMVPTYGGPYDSYTIPVRHEDGSYCRERYDHDNGWWVTDEIDDVGVKIVSDQAFVCDDRPPQPAQQPLSSARIDELIQEGVFGCNPYELVRRLEEERGVLKTRPLTDEQIDAMWQQSCREYFSGLQREIHLARAIEHAHGIK